MAVFAGRNWTESVAYLGAGLAILALIVLALGPLGWRLGWWHYRFAFASLMPWAAYGALAAAAVSILASFGELASDIDLPSAHADLDAASAEAGSAAAEESVEVRYARARLRAAGDQA